MMSPVLLQSPLPSPTHRGKVRETYDLGDGRLLIVATDRISAFDAVLPNGIPDKGAVLSQMAAFWFQLTDRVVPNHFIRLADGTAGDDLPFELPPELLRSQHHRQEGAAPRRRVHRPGLPDGLGVGRVPGDRPGLRYARPAGHGGVGAVPGAPVHADDQGRGRGTTRT